MSKTTRTALLWLVPVLLLLTWLIARGLDADLIWIDELMSIGNTGGLRKIPFNPLEVTESIRIQSPQHVPGFFILLSGWAGLVGWQPAMLRVPALFFALLAVAGVYRLGRDHIAPQVGLFAALVMAVSAMFIYFGHEIRMYTMIPALTAFFVWHYLRVVHRPQAPSRLAWAGLLLGGMALMYTHYYAALPLAAVGIYHLLFVQKNKRWWPVLVVLVVIALSFAPWLPVLVDGFTDVSERRSDLRTDALNPVQVLDAVASLFGNGLAPLFVIVIAFGAIAYKRDRRRIWLLALILLALLMIANLAIGMITERRTRYLISLWPLLAVLAGLGLSEIERRWRYVGRAALGVWLITGVVMTFNPAFLAHIDGPRHITRYPPLREMVGALAGEAGDNDLIVGFARTADIYTLYKINTIGEYYLGDLSVDYQFIGIDDWRAPTPAEQKQALRDAMRQRLYLWLAYEQDKIPAETVDEYRTLLDEHYQRCATLVDEPHLRIERYDRDDTGCLPQQPPQTPIAQFGGITLADLQVLPQDDGTVALIAGWLVDDTVPPETYSVSFKIRRVGDENFVAQADYGVRDVGFGWQLASIPTADLPEGDYEITATIYNWRTGEIVAGTLNGSSETGEVLPVAVLP